jgi:hypothetical protein
LEERERGIERGVSVVKRGKGREGMGKMPFFYLPSLPIQNRGGRAAFGRRWVLASWGRRRLGKRGKRRGRQRDSIPLPDLGCDGVQGWLDGGGRREVVSAYGGGAGEVKREGEVVARMRGGAGNVASPFIAAVWR